jgi:hypothetical protein
MKSSMDPSNLRGSFNSFLNNTVHAFYPNLRSSFIGKVKNIEEFNVWGNKTKERLNNDQICAFFKELRNEVIKSSANVLRINWGIFPNEMGFVQFKVEKGNEFLINTDYGLSQVSVSDPSTLKPIENVSGMKILSVTFDLKKCDKKFESKFSTFQGSDVFMLCEEYLAKLENVNLDYIKRFCQ